LYSREASEPVLSSISIPVFRPKPKSLAKLAMASMPVMTPTL
jgi:hypothetical protein